MHHTSGHSSLYNLAEILSGSLVELIRHDSGIKYKPRLQWFYWKFYRKLQLRSWNNLAQQYSFVRRTAI